MKSFRFKRFSIKQEPNVFRVGTDAVLLGALANCNGLEIGLEIGSGTGLISLMIAQRNAEINILALDINQEAATLSQENFSESPFSKRLKCICQDYNPYNPNNKFDFIFSNPPYFNAKHSKDLHARHQILISFSQLIEKSSVLLDKNGVLALIIPCESANFVENISAENNLFIKRKINIFGIKGGELKRNILEFSKEKPLTKVEEDFYIETQPRIYSEQYKTATKDFHPMF